MLKIIDQKETSCSSTAETGVLEAQPELSAENFSGNVYLASLGCSKNLVDSEVMLGAMYARGFRPVPEPENADVIIVNTCAFLQSAVEEGIDTILELAAHKQTGRCRKLIVAGCMVERYRSDLEKELPEVDRFLSTDELLDVTKASETTNECFDAARRPYFLYDEAMPRLKTGNAYSAYVKISEGCNRPCTFCIIPKIRGGLRSRSIASVVKEVGDLLDAGIKEISFVAQDLTAYGVDFAENKSRKPQLTSLLSELNRAYSKRDFWLRLHYAYPIGLEKELIEQIRDYPFIANYLDFPIQHISHPVLKAMQRPLGEKGTRELVQMIKTVAPELQLRTTFIVGFPGETEEDILALEQFVGEGHFTHVGVFTYSQEKEAKSFVLPDQIAEELKEERRARIMQVQQLVLERKFAGLIGKKYKVIVDGLHRDSDMLMSARADWQAPNDDGEIIVNDLSEKLRDPAIDGMDSFVDPARFIGQFLEVEITEVAGYDLVGRLL